jgi:hypothetical protein
MSRLKERKEKNCLNCDTEVQGRYCHNCGQENIEPKESFWGLVSHFFKDITHFDGNFFSTVNYLILKPGFLSKEYMIGRRASYVNPIRLYIFTSAFFFLIFFSFYQNKDITQINVVGTQAEIIKELESKRTGLIERLKVMTGTPVIQDETVNQKVNLENKIKQVEEDLALIKKDSTAKNRLQSLNYSFNIISFNKKDGGSDTYKTLHEYDSIQKNLPSNERDGFISSRFARQALHLQEKYNNNGKAILLSIAENFIHRFPQMLFISLPLFALLLKLLYIRRKNYYYVNHLIYTVHLYCASFIIILGGLWISSIFGWFNTGMPSWLNVLFILAGFFYIYKSLRNFYLQRRAKTVFKYLLLLFMTIILMVLLFAVFFIFSTFSL